MAGLGQISFVSETVEKIKFDATNYADLLTKTGMVLGDLAYVSSSQGTKWLPGSVGGSYYPEGWYRYDGANWVSDRNAISEAFNELTAYKSIAVNYTATNEDYFINSTASLTITLPTANRTPLKSFVIKNDSTGNITIQPNGAEMIEGENLIILTQKGESVDLKSTGAGWKIT